MVVEHSCVERDVSDACVYLDVWLLQQVGDNVFMTMITCQPQCSVTITILLVYIGT